MFEWNFFFFFWYSVLKYWNCVDNKKTYLTKGKQKTNQSQIKLKLSNKTKANASPVY